MIITKGENMTNLNERFISKVWTCWKLSDRANYNTGLVYIERSINKKFTKKSIVQYKLIYVQDIPRYIK